MTTLNQLTLVNGQIVNVTNVDQSQIAVDPLDGPTDVSTVMDRFPDTVYTQGVDTHLFKFVASMCGDAGAGYFKRLAFTSRLKNETGYLVFDDLDTFYAKALRFPRLPDELYTIDPTSDTITKDEWDAIRTADDSYRNRIAEFMQATQLGNSPDGMTLAAESGSGIQCDVIENYKAILNQMSDDVLIDSTTGNPMAIQGQTRSLGEFVITPRLLDDSGSLDANVAYQTDLTKDRIVTVIKTTLPDGHKGYSFVDTESFNADESTYMEPVVERNMIDVLDRLRPVGSLMTLEMQHKRFLPITIVRTDSLGNVVNYPLTIIAKGSSVRFSVTRFVTGSTSVNWPPVDSTQGFFIVSGEEREATSFPFANRELPVIFHTLQTAIAYTQDALADPSYRTAAFHLVDPATGVTPYHKYRTQHIGAFHPTISSIYTFLKNTPPNDLLSADKALAIQNTPLALEGRFK